MLVCADDLEAGEEMASDCESPGRPSSDQDEDDGQNEWLKWLFLVGIVVTLVVLAEEVGDVLLSTRSFLRSIPPSIGLPLIAACWGIRRLAPPIYYVVPVGTLTVLYLLRWGPYIAAVSYQAVKMLDVIWFLGIRRWYSRVMSLLLDPREDAARRYVPRDILRGLGGLDREWAQRIKEGGLRALATMVVLGCAWFTDELVTLYFFSTRCDLGLPSFFAGWFGIQVALLPEGIVRAFALEAVTANFTSLRAIRRGLLLAPVWSLVLWAVIAIVTTVLVHSVHVRLLSAEVRHRPEKDDAPRGGHRDVVPPVSAASRAERREAVRAQQVVELPPTPSPGQTSSDDRADAV